MPKSQARFPKLVTVTPYVMPGFPVDSPTLCMDNVQSFTFSLITGDGAIVATLGIWHTMDMAYVRLWYDNSAYEVGISKEALRVDKNALERAVTDMLLRCRMKFPSYKFSITGK